MRFGTAQAIEFFNLRPDILEIDLRRLVLHMRVGTVAQRQMKPTFDFFGEYEHLGFAGRNFQRHRGIGGTDCRHNLAWKCI